MPLLVFSLDTFRKLDGWRGLSPYRSSAIRIAMNMQITELRVQPTHEGMSGWPEIFADLAITFSKPY